jgi:tRNA1Val (adenine37-N6)-methyltransferase
LNTVVREGEHWEPLGGETSVLVSGLHKFNTDTILLADFSSPRSYELCADFGTGCGTIPLIWQARRTPKHIFAVEIQEEAASLAQRSIAHNGFQDAITLIRGDLRETEFTPAGSLDLIACNPPYKPDGTGIKNLQAALTIARHEVACSFAEIAETASKLLRWGGRFCCCLRPERLSDVIVTLRNAGLEPKRLRFVQQREGKPPFLFLVQANRGGKPGMLVEPVLFIEDGAGGCSAEMKQIYGAYGEGHK